MKELAAMMKALWHGEEGLGTLEMILIIAVLVAAVLLFKDKIKDLITKLFAIAGNKSQEVFND
ncbi:Flp1 family type IVb pilin [Paenibacillus glufosinatiresistens]|uniref:Flp1 family type IVb pilin n=1 Tax=Paenibacillus glufosinatiresistens TaxID=3070657 RepID=UPI00286D9EBF|nr:Flp1 family type IVb pilin [Paenibacillus sp. YX.27]